MGDTQYQPIMVNNIISGGIIFMQIIFVFDSGLLLDTLPQHPSCLSTSCVWRYIGIVVTLEVCKSVEAVWTSAGKGVLAGDW